MPHTLSQQSASALRTHAVQVFPALSMKLVNFLGAHFVGFLWDSLLFIVIVADNTLTMMLQVPIRLKLIVSGIFSTKF